MKSHFSGIQWKKKIFYYLSFPPVKAIIITIILLAIMLPYWMLAVEWAKTVLMSPDQQFAFTTTTFLLVLVIADSAFLVSYYQTSQKNELQKITEELKRSEEALLSANKKLALLSGITRHDIKNQLAALGGYIDLSHYSLNNPEKMEEIIEKEMNIARMINKEIDFTKDYEDMGASAPVWNNLHQMIRRASSGSSLGEIKVSEHDTDVEIYADPLVEKVFFNLIDNTLRHGGDNVSKIDISAKAAEGGLKILYTDDGEGISSSFRNNLFTRGYGRNTGLGLFLSKEILSITGISIQETGDSNPGVCFEIQVPPGGYRTLSKTT
ncbi:sensor histidine kinase [Methanolacinia paynteri]|uniref:sensor histidine kinase n=1 Tax=Methanolacinia paynteri TaxID=230356 RepID=UPI0006940168|nr:HAMP domain-containing sensor histidine kinase [Methanolacinia paynteri]